MYKKYEKYIEIFSFNLKDLNNFMSYNKLFKEVQIHNVSTIKNPKNQSLIFVQNWSKDIEDKLENINNSLILIKKNDESINQKIIAKNECIFVENPRLEYALILNYILRKRKKKKKYYKELENRIIIGENVNIGKEANIEPFVFIDHDVQIGDYCTLKSGARICSNVSIENNTIIGQNSVIGGPGFGIEKDNEGNLIRIPHIGGVIIGNNVEIDALTTIDSGTIEPTVIEDNVMINNHVHIAHNVYIEKNSIITGCCNISGSVHIKRDTWLGPNCSIKNGITIGKNVLVGMGAVVRKSTKDNVVLAGNPAKEIHK
jgi:UDP-3-O-[3-hydroxymyristoyl] glucosamine N-acyltransferase LpxD